jgi:cation:H+ antiporter
MLIDILLLIIGLGLLYYGGDILVLGCIRISRMFNVSPFVIGATIMGFGTSAPELAVSVLAALKGSSELALGNIVGSNIANIGLVLGLTALLTPLIITQKRFKESLPSLLIATFLLLVFTWDNFLSRLEGGVMLLGLVIYLWRILSRHDEGAVEMEEDDGKFFPKAGVAVQSILVVVGLVLLVLGADLMVKGGVNIARALGVSEWLIGISIIAIGTSLPEIVASIMSAKRGHGEMSLGNIFGSNIFNILMVLGTTAIIAPLTIIEKIHPDLIFTTTLTCLLLAMIRMGHKLTWTKGIILLACYFLYMGLKASGTI